MIKPSQNCFSLSSQDNRIPYNDGAFDVSDLPSKNPIEVFQSWFQNASAHPEVKEANAMALSTCTKDAKPSVRFVLLKKFDQLGFYFCTNYQSRKARELEENPCASCVLYWRPIHRQIRIEGEIIRGPVEESERYFASRPKDSKISASLFTQSSVIPDRQTMVEKYAEKCEALKDCKDVTRPEEWGYYILKPLRIEFWHGSSIRLHDRILFERKSAEPDDLDWKISRLAP